jgi:hypothetical protein
MKISIVINADSRPERDEFGGSNLMGCVSRDFLTDGIRNKIKAFDGFDKEVIVYLDEHGKLDDETLDEMREICDTLVIRKHSDWKLFNDDYYIKAMELATGDYIFKFDQDTNIFVSSKSAIEEQIALLETYDYVSYPSSFSPLPVHDPSFDYVWASSRYFCCKRETLDFKEIRKWLTDYDYAYSTYPASRTCHWVEHCLGILSKYKGKGVFYPPMEYDKIMIFCWGRYEKYILRRLNHQSYQEVRDWVLSKGGVNYPNDVFC